MPTIISKQEAVEQAMALHRLSEQGYIDVIKLANALGIHVYLREMPEGESAYIQYEAERERFMIIVNSNHPRLKQRFSIAHELAHYILHPQKIKKHRRVDRDGSHSLSIEEEKAADKLAAEILMPEELVHLYTKREDIRPTQALNEGIMQSIAQAFNVPMLVAIMRMRGLKFYVPYIVY